MAVEAFGLEHSTSAARRPGAFGTALEACTPKTAERWVWLAYDQLNTSFIDALPETTGTTGVVLIESTHKAKQQPYHQQKLAVLLSNQRHFALELQRSGIPVLYLLSARPYAHVLEELGASLGHIHAFQHAERSTRLEVVGLETTGVLMVHEHPGWLTSRKWFVDSVGEQPPFRMDAFYRTVRQHTGWLMEAGKPVGGKYSFDAENRFPWKGEPAAPSPPVFDLDEIDSEVAVMVEQRFKHHPGAVDMTSVPTSAEDIERAMRFAMEVLPWFGRYEDAMSEQSRGLFHSRLATLLNLHRVWPADLVKCALGSGAPLNSVEGFVRQLIWREYVHHIHDVTEGFTRLDIARASSTRGAGWSGGGEVDDGHPNFLQQSRRLPMAYWGQKSGLRCLDASVESVMEDGWTHHIPRLMVLSNLANLMDIDPRELTDWFHAAFIDAYDWVVEPNVLGMGTFALGSVMMTKPYVSGSAYINKMSDHCSACAFHPKKNCPITSMYWAYLYRHRTAFAGNHRMAIAMKNVERRSDEQKATDEATYLHVVKTLEQGESLEPPTHGDLRRWTSSS